MPTNPIPSGTCNLPVNLPKVARAAVGRLAFANSKYVGEFMRGLLIDRLEIAMNAGEISRELAMDAMDALAAHGQRAKSVVVKVAKVSCLLLVCGLSVFSGMVRGGRRSARRPSASVARVVRGNARKIGEWGVYAS